MAEDATQIFGFRSGVMVASAGYAIFGVGAEVAGITVTKVIAKWFRGKEMATAMGVQVAWLVSVRKWRLLVLSQWLERPISLLRF